MDFDDEFQESDFMFSDYSSDQSTETSDDNNNNNNNNMSRNEPGYNKSSNGSSLIMLKSKKSILPKVQRQRRIISSSLPINIPLGNNSFRYDDDNDDDVECSELFDEDYSDDNEDQWSRIPPHLIVERRVNGEMARSFSPLKGRNLCEVRNSILRLTGFLER